MAIRKVINSLFNGVYYLLHDSGICYYYSSVVLIFLISSIIVAYSLLLIILFIKNLRIFIHDIARLLPFSDINILSIISSILIILLPLTIGGVSLFIIAIPIFIWGYLKRDTRVLIMMAIPFILLLPIIIHFVSKGLIVSNSNRYLALERIVNNSYDEEAIKILSDEYKKRSDDTTVNFSLGLIYKKKGDISRARRFYEDVLQKEPENKYILVNMGNLFFIKEEYNTAVQYYKRALKVDERLFEAHYNMSEALSELNDFEGSLRESSIAMELYNEKTRSYPRRFLGHPNQSIPDLPPSPDILISERERLRDEVDQLSKEIWAVILKRIERDKILIVILILLALYLFYVNRYEDIYSLTCKDCGMIIHGAFKYQKLKEKRCIRCLALSREGDSMEDARREVTKRDIKRYKQKRNILSILFNIFIPGSGRIILGRYVTGFFGLLITSFFISGLIFAFTSQPISAKGLRYILLSNYYILGLFIIYYLSSNLSLFKYLRGIFRGIK
ncbi:MAG: tetratricopeptide repeat protein [Nitrospinae bacterium]|nr:tetratricopeptide repeat protein [Nitrospinota bacterium]